MEHISLVYTYLSLQTAGALLTSLGLSVFKHGTVLLHR